MVTSKLRLKEKLKEERAKLKEEEEKHKRKEREDYIKNLRENGPFAIAYKKAIERKNNGRT